jgi:hypothetical protein
MLRRIEKNIKIFKPNAMTYYYLLLFFSNQSGKGGKKGNATTYKFGHSTFCFVFCFLSVFKTKTLTNNKKYKTLTLFSPLCHIKTHFQKKKKKPLENINNQNPCHLVGEFKRPRSGIDVG